MEGVGKRERRGRSRWRKGKGLVSVRGGEGESIIILLTIYFNISE